VAIVGAPEAARKRRIASAQSLPRSQPRLAASNQSVLLVHPLLGSSSASSGPQLERPAWGSADRGSVHLGAGLGHSV